jgi:hypothetical protein
VSLSLSLPLSLPLVLYLSLSKQSFGIALQTILLELQETRLDQYAFCEAIVSTLTSCVLLHS